MKLYQTLAEVVFGPQSSDPLLPNPSSTNLASSTSNPSSQDTANGVFNQESKPDVANSDVLGDLGSRKTGLQGAPSRPVASTSNEVEKEDDEDVMECDNSDSGSPASTLSGGTFQSGCNAGANMGEGDNVCHVCQYRFRRISHLRQHVQEVHEKERKFSCDICKRLFKRAEHLRKHMKTVHKGDQESDNDNECIVLS